MKHSASITALAPALVKAQGDIKAVGKDSVNPAFRSKYASLDTIMDAVRPLLYSHGLALIQGVTTPDRDEAGHLACITVDTTIVHTSGEWITTSVVIPVGTIPVKNKDGDVIDALPTAQTAGSAVTYGRRYGVSALLAITTDEDDDGAVASQRAEHQPTQAKRAPVPTSSAKSASSGAVTTLPVWPNYELSGKPIADAPDAELKRLMNWTPKNNPAQYDPLKVAIAEEQERRRLLTMPEPVGAPALPF